jgi:uncharacterized protein
MSSSSPAELAALPLAGTLDLDFHPYITSRDPLLERMPAAWAERLRSANLVLPAFDAEAFATDPEAADVATEPRRASAAWVERHQLGAALLVAPQALATVGWLDHAMCTEYVRAFNDLLIEEWLPVDPRFRLAAAVSPHDPAAAAKEIHRVGELAGVTAVALPLIDVNLGHRHYHPIYAAALEHGLGVVVHPSRAEGVALGAPTLGGGVQKTPAERLALLPQVAAANLASIVFDGVLERNRELTVLFSGFGFEWIVSALWRFDKEWQALRIDVPWVERSPSEQVGSQVKVAVSGVAPAARHADVAALAGMVPDGVLAYGSNRPESLATPSETIASLFPATMLDAVGLGNGAALVDG